MSPRPYCLLAYAFLSAVYAQDTLRADDRLSRAPGGMPPTSLGGMPATSFGGMPPPSSNVSSTAAGVPPPSPGLTQAILIPWPNNANVPSTTATSPAETTRINALDNVNGSTTDPVLLTTTNDAGTTETLPGPADTNASDVLTAGGSLAGDVTVGNASMHEVGTATLTDSSNSEDVTVAGAQNTSVAADTTNTTDTEAPATSLAPTTDNTDSSSDTQQVETEAPSPAPSIRPKTSSSTSVVTTTYAALACVSILCAYFL
ncbi:hypothetical protein PsorP6_015637 [Peronosclerospora sorghi]|uniref:Uncharacterized protein n=1 Tax=Peronosclerospora sorghi TaxID=230839 RepID=A0ACC0WQI5_9STRA|nr:hypothetical protein PsorP6_015637 [Peronosclerospora sorghi]